MESEAHLADQEECNITNLEIDDIIRSNLALEAEIVKGPKWFKRKSKSTHTHNSENSINSIAVARQASEGEIANQEARPVRVMLITPIGVHIRHPNLTNVTHIRMTEDRRNRNETGRGSNGPISNYYDHDYLIETERNMLEFNSLFLSVSQANEARANQRVISVENDIENSSEPTTPSSDGMPGIASG
jgi:hypothetical protein